MILAYTGNIVQLSEPQGDN